MLLDRSHLLLTVQYSTMQLYQVVYSPIEGQLFIYLFLRQSHYIVEAIFKVSSYRKLALTILEFSLVPL